MEPIILKNDMTYAVLNPNGTRQEVAPNPIASRVSDLNSKVVYCVGQVIMGSEVFIEKVAKALPEYIPGAKVVFKRKPAAYMTDDPELWDEIVSEADALIYGCGA